MITEFLYDIDFLLGYSRYTVGPFFCGILYCADVISPQTDFNPTGTTTAETKTTIHPTPPPIRQQMELHEALGSLVPLFAA